MIKKASLIDTLPSPTFEVLSCSKTFFQVKGLKLLSETSPMRPSLETQTASYPKANPRIGSSLPELYAETFILNKLSAASFTKAALSNTKGRSSFPGNSVRESLTGNPIFIGIMQCHKKWWEFSKENFTKVFRRIFRLKIPKWSHWKRKVRRWMVRLDAVNRKKGWFLNFRRAEKKLKNRPIIMIGQIMFSDLDCCQSISSHLTLGHRRP